MEIHPDEAHLFHPEPKQRNAWADISWIDWLCALAFGIILGLSQGCDGQAAANTAVAEQEAHEKVAVMSMPCTWIAQCNHLMTACPIQSRSCVRAE